MKVNARFQNVAAFSQNGFKLGKPTMRPMPKTDAEMAAAKRLAAERGCVGRCCVLPLSRTAHFFDMVRGWFTALQYTRALSS